MSMKLNAVLAFGLAFAGSMAHAKGACDYKPSKLVGAAAATVSAAGVGLKAAGLYAIQNATTGAMMLGSTATGASAAGTVGILPGTAGVIGTVGTALISAPVIVGAGVVAVGAGIYEGGCYLAKK